MHIHSSLHAYQIFKKYLTNEVEELWAMALSSTLDPIAVELIFKGTVDHCLVHPRDIFRFAIKHNASQIIIAHNHPSQDIRPSPEDIKITKKLEYCGVMLEVPLIDHLILNKISYFSMAQAKIIGQQNHQSRRPRRLKHSV